MPPCVCAQACVTFCASMHTRAFKGEHCPSCKYAHICKCLLSQQATHTHKIPLNACTHTHTSSTQGCLSSEFSDPSERRTNTLMDSLCLRDAFEFLPSSLFPFPLSLFFPSLLVTSIKAPRFPESTNSQHLNASLQPDLHSLKPERMLVVSGSMTLHLKVKSLHRESKTLRRSSQRANSTLSAIQKTKIGEASEHSR